MPKCKVCFAQQIGLTSISIIPNELCDPHYRDWSDEKSFGEWY